MMMMMMINERNGESDDDNDGTRLEHDFHSSQHCYMSTNIFVELHYNRLLSVVLSVLGSVCSYPLAEVYKVSAWS